MSRKRGRLPATKVKRPNTEFYPLHRCKYCSSKWKRVDRDPEHMETVLSVRSCKDDCPFVKSAGGGIDAKETA